MSDDGNITRERSEIAPQSLPQAPQRLEIFALGALSIRLDQRPLPPFHSRKAEALLVYLACTRQDHPREVLADMFWDERSQTRAATNLRTLLASMRQTLAPYLRITRRTIGLNLQSDLWLDTHAFEEWSERYDPPHMAQLESAVALYRGDFLSGFYIRESPRFEEWVLMQQERLRRKVVLALHSLVAHCLALEEYTRGVEWASRLLQIDALDEQAHRQMMVLLALGGQPPAALAHYESMHRLFAAQLGFTPNAETTLLYDQIRSGEWAIPRAPLPASQLEPSPISTGSLTPDTGGPAPRPRTKLVGRETQLAALGDLLAQASNAQSRIALIAGEAGIGKSRLVAEVKAVAARRGVRILEGRCFEQDRTFPYAPLIDMLRGFSASRTPGELASAFGATGSEIIKVFPELSTYLPHLRPTPALEPEQEKRRLFQSLVQFVHNAGAKGRMPLLLIVEDLHWCDDTSLAWLLTLARQLESRPMLVLLTYRADEIQPTLHQLLAALDRMTFVSELKLSLLTRAEADAMLGSILNWSSGARVEFLDALYALTDGNPFFIEEVLKSLISAGDLYQVGGEWTRKPLRELHIPRTVQVAVQQRTRQLSDATRFLLTLAAVAGQRFDVRVLQAATGSSESELLGHVKDLLAAQLVVEETDETFVFRHALTRQAIETALLARERKSLHRAVAEATQSCYAGSLDSHASDLAHHFVAAGLWAQAQPWAQLAGDQASHLYAHAEALSHYTRARECAAALGQTEQVAALDHAIAKVYFARGEVTHAVEAYERALHATTHRAPRAVLKAELGAAYLNIANERGLTYLHEALDELNAETQPRPIAFATLWLGRSHNYRAQYTQALTYLERARQLSESLNDLTILRLVYSSMADALTPAAHFEQSMQWARRCLALGEAHQDWKAMALAYVNLSYAVGHLGRWQAMDDFGRRGREFAQRAGWLNVDVWNAMQCAGAAYYQGELQTAVQVARESLALATQIRDGRAIVRAQQILVVIESALGNEQTAFKLGEQAVRDADALIEVGLRAMCRMVLAGVHAQREEWPQAFALYEQCAALMGGTENRTVQMDLGLRMAEALGAQGRLDEAVRLVAGTLEETHATGARHFESEAWRVQGHICAAQGRHDDALSSFDQAIRLCQEMGTRLELAHALYQRGALHHARHDLVAVRSDWTQARTLCEQMGARLLLARVHMALAQLAPAQSD